MSWWQAEGDATDALGVNNGTIQGAVGFVPGRVGQAFSFPLCSNCDEPNDVAVASPVGLQTPAVTAMAWVKRSGSPGAGAYVVAQLDVCAACTSVSYGLTSGASGNLSFQIFDGVSVVSSPDAAPAIWDGNWHLAAGTYDGAAVRLYIDGVQVGAGTADGSRIHYTAGQSFLIGAGSFSGAVDVVMIFSRALSAAEIMTVFTTTP